MQIFFKKSFVKQYHKLNKSDQGMVDSALVAFEKNPKETQLNNHHQLRAKLGLRILRNSKGFNRPILSLFLLRY